MRTNRILGPLFLLLFLLAPPGAASGYSRHRHHHRSSHYYTNVEGRRVHSPVFTRHAPAGASAECRDGSYSFSQHHQGTCSHHGGVLRWLR
jgi:hypothetical protein